MTRIGLRVVALSFALAAPFVAHAAQNPFDGKWEAGFTVNSWRCTANLVMGPGQRYSELIKCRPPVGDTQTTWQSGTYVLSKDGLIVRNVIDWEPKQRFVLDSGYSGHWEPNAKPPGGSYRVNFTSPNMMVWRDVKFGGALTYRRLQ